MAALDFDKAYKVRGYSGIAWYLQGYEKRNVPIMALMEDEEGNEWEEESGEWEEEENQEKVVAVMVGDDREFIFDVEDVEEIPADSYCRSCGQIGCSHNVYE